MKEKFDKIYDPKIVEDKIYRLWEKSGYFNPDKLPGQRKKPFTIIMPPPNANGALHFGHALFVTLEDLMIRYKRMQGYKTLWLPGADHAGFETQVVFDKKLEREDRNRFEIPADELYKEMMDFTLANKKVMENQLRKLGASCDWSREKFTLDKNIIETVYDTFEKLYEDGLVYRDSRVINWCVKHQTSLSDLEIKHEERNDKLYYIKYQIAGSDDFITVATTRPETIPADVAIAINPKSKWAKFAGQKAVNPLTKEKIPVIVDASVDLDFGTGALKITPFHDAADFEIWQKHKNEIDIAPFSAINEYGKMTELAGTELSGLKIPEAREKSAEILKADFIKEPEDYKHQISVCYKCGTIIEPRVMMQWFIKMTEKPKSGGLSLRDSAVKAIKSKKIKFVPKRFEKVFFHWMKNLRDWNISRQIVWGIRIPAWYCDKNRTEGKTYAGSYEGKNDTFDLGKEKSKRIYLQFSEGTCFVGENPPHQCSIHSNGKDLIQDPDVFDTWFSSGQWPFATLMTSGKNDFKTFYPTDVMETGWDILFFWVARMIMLGIYVTGKIPFKYVYLHGLVRDKDRQKMSKSKGNVIDPLGVAETYGTDAIRMALIMGTTPGNDPIISEDKIRGYRNFANKIWNASRFVLINLKGFNSKKKFKFSRKDKRILQDLEKLTKEITQLMESFKFYKAAEKLYHYFWHTFADKIIEEQKTRFNSQDKKEIIASQCLLLEILKTNLKLLHPFMPFITEEIYQKLPIIRRGSRQVKDKPRRKVGAPTRTSEKLLMIEKW